MQLNLLTKNTRYEIKEIKKTNIPKKIIKLIPEINIKVNQVNKIKIDWPISGWDINNKIIGTIKIKVSKYLKYKLYF